MNKQTSTNNLNQQNNNKDPYKAVKGLIHYPRIITYNEQPQNQSKSYIDKQENKQFYNELQPNEQYNQQNQNGVQLNPLLANLIFNKPQIFKDCILRSYTNPNQQLFASNDGVRSYGKDYDVRTHPYIEERNKFTIQPQGNTNTFVIIHQLSGQYLFIANDGSKKYKGDYDVRTHPFIEERNKFIIQKSQKIGGWIIKSAVCNHYLFCSNDGVNAYSNDYDVRSHVYVEDRNLWFIDGFKEY